MLTCWQFVVDLIREAGLFPYGNDATSALQRARGKQFVELFLLKVNPFWYGAIIRAEPNQGAPLIASIKTFIEPLFPAQGPFVLGAKFGLPEILVAPFVVRIYLAAKLGLLGEGAEAGFAKLTKWDAWARAVLANESVKKTFNYEFEARKAIDRIRKVREAAKGVAVNGTTAPKV